MKSVFFTFLLIVFAAGFPLKGIAAHTFDVPFDGVVDEFVVSETAISSEDASREAADVCTGEIGLFNLFAHSVRDFTASALPCDFMLRPVHGQPLPGVLITLLLGAIFGLSRRLGNRACAAQPDHTNEDVHRLIARLLGMQILFLNPPETIHAISPGPELFCLRE